MKRIITFGEIMMRLNPAGYLRFLHTENFEATYAGGEANVAVSLANYGMDAAFVTKVPVVDSNNLKALSAEHLTESQTADTTKTIDSNFNRHGIFLHFLSLLSQHRLHVCFGLSISPYGFIIQYRKGLVKYEFRKNTKFFTG